MKLLLLLFMLLSVPQDKNCSEFYQTTLVPIHVDGELQKKEMTNEYYILFIRKKTDEVVQIKLLKNKTGLKIYNFALLKSRIVKVKGEFTIRVMAPRSNGFTVQLFPDLCDE